MLIAFATASLLLASPLQAKDPLATVAERTKYDATGRYEEVERLCAAFQQTFPGKVKCQEIARTPEGRPMLAVIASADGTLDAKSAKAAKRPVVLFQGGIHAGEIDGKDAGFLVLREILQGKAGSKGLLEKVTAVFVPVFNVDGHERWGVNNRPNQVGPREMGWRTTSQNLNLNRDYAKADAPEMRAMLSLLAEWDPIVYLDLHVTDGAKFRHGIAFLVEPTVQGAPELMPLAKEFRDRVVKKLEKAGHLPIAEFYPSFEEDDDPASGFSLYAAPPRFSTAYWASRNRIGVLVETHAWKDYETRVRSTRDSVLHSLEAVAAKGAALLEAAAKADEAARKIGGTTFVAVRTPAGKPRIIDFKGYAYTRSLSDVSGGTRIVYDDRKPEIWKIPLHDKLVPAISVTLPKGGYIVPASHAAWMKERLSAHGLEFSVIPAAKPGLYVETFRAVEVKFGNAPYEGRQTLKAGGAWAKEKQDISAGSLFVPIAQPGARLVAHLFEPAAPDSFLAWGFFNAHFERKEYMEAYVAEDVARVMLKDPAVKKEFDAKVASDAAFAKDPGARLDFFYRRHPSFDARLNLYPVFRVDAAP